MEKFYGAIEGGGTKWVCAVGSGPEQLLAQSTFPTRQPAATLEAAISFFREQIQLWGPLAGIGIGSFGPVDLAPTSPTYGYITSTPKPGWQNTDVVGKIRYALDVPVVFDTDVNAAVWGEFQWGAGEGLSDLVYLTVGTGIGGGVISGGKLVHGLMHPEIGHMRIPSPQGSAYRGVCPFHDRCLEGLASGPAIQDRWGQPAETLPVDHPAWEHTAHILAAGLMNLVCTLSPQRIILGGGVMKQAQLFPLIHKALLAQLNGYIQSPVILREIDQFVVPPKLGSLSGVLGAIALARTLT